MRRTRKSSRLSGGAWAAFTPLAKPAMTTRQLTTTMAVRPTHREFIRATPPSWAHPGRPAPEHPTADATVASLATIPVTFKSAQPEERRVEGPTVPGGVRAFTKVIARPTRSIAGSPITQQDRHWMNLVVAQHRHRQVRCRHR